MRLFCVILIVVLLGACSRAGEVLDSQPVAVDFIPEAREDAPNIIIMMADDLGWADLGFRGSDIRTPNIDRLAREGMVLDRFYSLPICTPTRAALMTGRDPMKLGAAYAGFQPWQNGGVAPQERFMSEAFQEAGYQTAMVGKWHLGHTTEPLTPNARGFEHFVGHLNTQIDYNTHTSAGGHDLQENGVSIKREGYATDVHADEAVRFLTDIRDPHAPFFLYVPFLAPHSPMQAPDELKANYPTRLDRPFPKKTYAAMVESLDLAVGRILDTLDAQGLAENTLILFFSDNGGLGVFGADNGPWRGGKLETFEGGIRVASVMRWPGQVPAGSAAEDAVSVMDLFPTLTNLAGLPTGAEKPLDGQDVWTTLLDGEAQVRDGRLFFASNSPIYNRFHMAVIEGDWKLVQIIDHTFAETEVETMLFDLAEDPSEANDLSSQFPDRVEDLSKAIRDWQAQHPINGVRVALAPHPGWRAPKDWAEAVVPESDLQTDPTGLYVKGLRATMLQRQHGDKGSITYD